MVPRTDPAYARFLTRLADARGRAQLTQAEVAAALGKPQSFVSKCESGERRVDVIELARFARVYGRRLEWFVTPEDRP